MDVLSGQPDELKHHRNMIFKITSSERCIAAVVRDGTVSILVRSDGSDINDCSNASSSSTPAHVYDLKDEYAHSVVLTEEFVIARTKSKVHVHRVP